jgi:alpha-2-macroglobulin
MKIAFLFIIILLNQTTVFGQTNWNAIESNLNNKRNLVTLYESIENLQNEALVRKEYFTVARCYNYLIRIKDLKTEDTLFFKNSACLDSLIEDIKTTTELKSAVYVLQAKRIAEFSYRYFHRGNKNLFTEIGKVSYRNMSKLSLDSVVEDCFNRAIILSKTLANATAAETLWLSSHPFVFLCKPSYTDILYAEKINAFDFLKTTYSVSFGKETLKLSQDQFINVLYNRKNQTSDFLKPNVLKITDT